MAHITADRVRDTTTTTGTGNITLLNTPPTGFRTLGAVAATSDTFFYCLELGAEWEVGLGTYSGTNVFVRTQVLSSSNSGSLVNFSAGTKNFFITLPASKLADDTAYASTWDGDTTTAPSKNAVYDRFEELFRYNYVASRWYNLDYLGMSRAAVSGFVQNRIHLSQILVPRRLTISDLAFNIASGGIAGNAQLAIYASNKTTGLPTGNALAVTGNMSTASSTTVTADITGANVTLEPGIYWSAINMDPGTTPSFFGPANSTSNHGFVYGASAAADVINAFGHTGLWVNQTFGTWPDLTLASFTGLNVGISIAVRAA